MAGVGNRTALVVAADDANREGSLEPRDQHRDEARQSCYPVFDNWDEVSAILGRFAPLSLLVSAEASAQRVVVKT